jgi:hypothetical protein
MNLILKTFSVLSLVMVMASNANASEAITPEKVLPDGVDSATVMNPFTGEKGFSRKGTVAATIQNIAALNKLFANKPSKENDKDIENIMAEIKRLVPFLRVIGVFDMFNVDEWLDNTHSTQWGRIVCALLYIEQYPELLNDARKKQILILKASSPSKAINKIIDRLV